MPNWSLHIHAHRLHTYCICIYMRHALKHFQLPVLRRWHFWCARMLYLICAHTIWCMIKSCFNRLTVLICEQAWRDEAEDSLTPLSAFLIIYMLLVGRSSRWQRDLNCVCVEFTSLLWYSSCLFHDAKYTSLRVTPWTWGQRGIEFECVSVHVCACSYRLGAASCDV